MPFNPALPQNGSALSSAVVREQFNGLKALIDELPAGVTQQELSQAMDSLQTSVNEAVAMLQTDLESAVGNLTTEIETTRQMSANNVDGINILDVVIGNPPSQEDVQAMVDKLNELINGLRR